MQGDPIKFIPRKWSELAHFPDHRFDYNRVAQVLDSCPEDREEELQQKLIAQFGLWIEGWRWTAGRLQRPLSRLQILQAIQEWHGFLLDMADQLPGWKWTSTGLACTTQGVDLQEELDEAMARVAPVLVAHSQGDASWNLVLESGLAWCLELLGRDAVDYVASIQDAVHAHFIPGHPATRELAAFICADLVQRIENTG